MPPMKAILFCAALTTMLFQTGYAQLSRGSFMTGATFFPLVRHQLDGSVKVKSSSIRVVPGVSYFLTDHLAVGLVAPWGYTRHKSQDRLMTLSTYAVGPAVRYYFPFGRWAVFPTVSYSLGRHIQETVDTSFPANTVKGHTRTLMGGLGITYFIGRHMGVECSLGYGTNKVSWDDEADRAYDTSLITLDVGVQVYLFKK